MTRSVLSLSDVQAQVAAWRDASLKLAEGQSVSMNGRTLTRSNSREVLDQLNYWLRKESEFLAREAGRQSIGFSRARFS